MGVAGPGPDAVGLLAEYGGIHAEPSSRRRAQRLAGLIVRSLRSTGISAAVRDDLSPVSVAFRISGHPYLIGLAQTSEWELPAGEEAVHEARRAALGASVIVLSMSGFTGHRALDAASADSGGTVLWDRTHLEAVLCGLVSLPDLLDASIDAAFFRNALHEPLARLLVPADRDAAPRLATPDQVPPPWPLTGPEQPDAGARLALTGEGPWPRPSGIAVLAPGRLLAVTPAGLLDLNAAHGAGSWFLRLPRCTGEPLVLPDGSVLVIRGRAVARTTATSVEAVGGEFDGGPRLLAGPGGEPWVLSAGWSDSPGEGVLALTRLGARPGEQHRYQVDCADDVQAAAWLGGLRFFLAAPGRSAVIDLARSTRVTEDDWTESPWAGPASVVADGPHHVVVSAAEPATARARARVALFRADVRTGGCERIAGLALAQAAGLCADDDGTGYLLGDLGGGPGPWPALIRIPGLRGAVARPPGPGPATPPEPDFPQGRWDSVRLAALGREQDYELDARPLDRGGQAEVYGARHRQTGLRVAFKRLRRRTPHTVARMRREIEAAQALGDSPHVMPVLDYGPRYDWLVMPLADESAESALPSLREGDGLRALVTAVCEGLRHAHEIGWIHRDLKPANLLRLGGTWTVADWGLVRRPLGATSQPGRTRLGAPFGTVGFGAPELSPDPHHAGPPADVYGIGQIIGWVITGQLPQANTPLIPPDGPWRQVVRAATQHDPERRPATVDALLALVSEELDYQRPDISAVAGRLSEEAGKGDARAGADLFALAARYPDETLLYTEALSAMTREAVIAAVDATRHDTIELARTLGERARDTALTPDQAARVTTVLHWIQAHAGDAKDLGLLEEAARAVFAWDEHWNQETPRREIARWLPSRRGDQAAAIARALREAPGSARHFASVLRDGQADERVQRAVRAARGLIPASAYAETATPPDTEPTGAAGDATVPDTVPVFRPPLPAPAASRRQPPDGDRGKGGEQALYSRCTPAEQALWQRLAVFAGPFDADAAEEVCADAALDASAVTEALAGLAATAAVTVQESAAGVRYRLRGACRQLGLDKLASGSQEMPCRGRHFARYLGLARRFADRFPGQDGLSALRQVRAAYPDIRAALEYASGDELAATDQGPGAARLAAALTDFWSADGRIRDGWYWLGRTAGRCPYPSRELARALIARGHLGTLDGQARDGAADIREGIRVASGLGDPETAALGNLRLTQALTFAEYYEEAAAAGTEAYRLLRTLDDEHGKLRLQAALACLETLAGGPGQAVARCERALRNPAARDGWIRGYLQAAMAFAQFRRQDPDAACETSTREALRVYQEYGDLTGIAYTLELLGWLAVRAGRHMRAAWLLGAADTLWTSAGTRLGGVPTLEELHTVAEASAWDVLTGPRFDAVRAMGSGSPLNEIIAFALGDVSIKIT